MTLPKDDKRKRRDLRHGLKGEVMVDNNFVGLPPASRDDGPKAVSPDVGTQASGQTTHE